VGTETVQRVMRVAHDAAQALFCAVRLADTVRL